MNVMIGMLYIYNFTLMYSYYVFSKEFYFKKL